MLRGVIGSLGGAPKTGIVRTRTVAESLMSPFCAVRRAAGSHLGRTCRFAGRADTHSHLRLGDLFPSKERCPVRGRGRVYRFSEKLARELRGAPLLFWCFFGVSNNSI